MCVLEFMKLVACLIEGCVVGRISLNCLDCGSDQGLDSGNLLRMINIG